MTRHTLAYFGAYSLSLLGNGIASVLFPLLVLAKTGDVLAAGIVATATTGVGAVVGVFAGVVVDRFNRRTVSVVSDVLSAASVAALPIVDALWGLHLTWFIVLGVIGAFGDVPGLTARESLLPRLVARQRSAPHALDRLVGIREGVSGVLLIAGPGLGGLIVWLIGVSATAMWVTAATSLAAAIVSLTLPRDIGAIDTIDIDTGPASTRPATGTGPARVVRDLLDGWKFLFGHRLVLGATLVSALSVAVLTALQVVILPAYFTDVDLPGLTGLVIFGIALGSVVGAGLYSATIGRVSRRTWFVVAVCGSAIGFLALGSLAAPWVVLIATVWIGLTNGPFSALIGVVTIEAIPDRLRGRVLGAQNAVLLAAPALLVTPIAAFAAGFGLAATGLAVGALVTVVMLAALVSPAFRGLDAPAQDRLPVAFDATPDAGRPPGAPQSPTPEV
ncbi:MFS transporter [Leucobacter aridicollis]|uniref:MFS transporter n=1 Tax=Leucobacter aridicollis TaxID=283878 RepID=UPI0021674143|nr:MFS transporter [Leucobacter aridicollis]MCS3428171.1 MFS family permease [Leucobacter aridicollis]